MSLPIPQLKNNLNSLHSCNEHLVLKFCVEKPSCANRLTSITNSNFDCPVSYVANSILLLIKIGLTQNRTSNTDLAINTIAINKTPAQPTAQQFCLSPQVFRVKLVAYICKKPHHHLHTSDATLVLSKVDVKRYPGGIREEHFTYYDAVQKYLISL